MTRQFSTLLHKKSIFATVLGEDGKILSRVNIRSKKEDISYYLREQGSKEEVSLAVEASHNWLYYISFMFNFLERNLRCTKFLGNIINGQGFS